MNHFSLLLNANAPANQLQREALELLRSKSQLLVEDAAAFIDGLRRQIDELNAKHPRCRSLKLYTYDASNSIGVALGAGFTVGFYVYPVRGRSEV